MLMFLGHTEPGTWGLHLIQTPLVLSGESGKWREAAIKCLHWVVWAVKEQHKQILFPQSALVWVNEKTSDQKQGYHVANHSRLENNFRDEPQPNSLPCFCLKEKQQFHIMKRVNSCCAAIYLLSYCNHEICEV